MIVIIINRSLSARKISPTKINILVEGGGLHWFRFTTEKTVQMGKVWKYQKKLWTDYLRNLSVLI